MPVTFRTAATPNGNPTTGFDIAIPNDVAIDDLMFLVVTSRDATTTGGVSVSSNDVGGNPWEKIGESSNGKASLWWKRATANTPSATLSVSGCVGSSSGVLAVYSGADNGTTPYSNVTIESNASGNEAHAGFTPAEADSMICLSVHNYGNDNAVTSPSTTSPGALNIRGEKLSTGGSDCATHHASALQSGGPTATGNFTWAQTNGATFSIVWAIRPLAAVAAEFSGAATISAGVVGALAAAIAFVGSAISSVASAALLSSAIIFGGATAPAAEVAGNLTAAAAPAEFSGAATVGVAASGDLSTSLPLSGGANVATIASSDLTTALRFTGTAAVSAESAADLTTALNLAGQSNVATAVDPDITTATPLAGAAAIGASVVGDLTAPGAAAVFSGGANVTASLAGDLTTAIEFAGERSLVSDAAADLSSAVNLAGAAAIAAAATGDLTAAGVAAELSGSAAIDVGVAGEITTAISMEGAAAPAAAIAGELATSIEFVGDLEVSVSAAGNLTAPGDLIPIDERYQVELPRRIYSIEVATRRYHVDVRPGGAARMLTYSDPMPAGENRPVTMGFSKHLAELAEGVTLTGVPVVTASVSTGTDPAPQSIVVGPAEVQGDKVVQRVHPTLPGVDYLLTFDVDTSDNGHLVDFVILRVR